MSRGVNKFLGIGNCGRDPEMRSTPSGVSVCNVSLAINDWGGKERGETVTWLDLVFFGRQAEIAQEYLRKGSQVFVEGKIDVNDWEDKEGTKRRQYRIIVHQFQMLGSPAHERAERTEPRKPATTRKPAPKPAPTTAGGHEFDDDVPFGPHEKGSIA